MQTFNAQVTRVTELTHDVRVVEFGLVDPPHIDFIAGQFVTFRVPKLGAPGIVSRAYSIASPPRRRNSLDILFNLVENGPGSTYLWNLRPGELSQFRGPSGNFVLEAYPDRDVLFVATGTGIAPMISMIETRLPSARKARLLWGLRNERDLYYQREFEDLAARHPEFSFETILSRPSGGWTGAVGRVQKLVQEQVTSVADLAVYICGNTAMIDSVSELIRVHGDCPIHYEQYYLQKADEEAEAFQ